MSRYYRSVDPKLNHQQASMSRECSNSDLTRQKQSQLTSRLKTAKNTTKKVRLVCEKIVSFLWWMFAAFNTPDTQLKSVVFSQRSLGWAVHAQMRKTSRYHASSETNSQIVGRTQWFALLLKTLHGGRGYSTCQKLTY